MESMRLPALPMGLHPSITRTPASTPGRPPGQPCHKGTNLSIAITPFTVDSRHHARTGSQQKMNGRLFGYAACQWPAMPTPRTWRISVGSWLTASRCMKVWGWGFLEPAGPESPEGRPPAGRLREDGSAGPLGRSLAEVLELLAWLRGNDMEGDLARERTLAELNRVRATGKHVGRRKGVSRKHAEEIQNVRQRDGAGSQRLPDCRPVHSAGSASGIVRR